MSSATPEQRRRRLHREALRNDMKAIDQAILGPTLAKLLLGYDTPQPHESSPKESTAKRNLHCDDDDDRTDTFGTSQSPEKTERESRLAEIALVAARYRAYQEGTCVLGPDPNPAEDEAEIDLESQSAPISIPTEREMRNNLRYKAKSVSLARCYMWPVLGTWTMGNTPFVLLHLLYIYKSWHDPDGTEAERYALKVYVDWLFPALYVMNAIFGLLLLRHELVHNSVEEDRREVARVGEIRRRVLGLHCAELKLLLLILFISILLCGGELMSRDGEKLGVTS